MREESSQTSWRYCQKFPVKKWTQCCICGAVLMILLYVGIDNTEPYLPRQWVSERLSGIALGLPSLDNPVSCGSLLVSVRLSGVGNHSELFHSNGCKLTNMTQKTLQDCIKPGTHFVFVGDSRVRQLYCYFRYFWGHKHSDCIKFQHDERIHIKSANITLDFKWCPHSSPGIENVFKKWVTDLPASIPDFILAGAGVWEMRESNATAKGELEYRRNLRVLKPYMTEMSKHTTVLWIPQDTVAEELLDDRRRMLSNRLVNRYNQIAHEVLEMHGIPIWWSSFLTAQHFHNFRTDCVHIKSIVDKYKTQILLNWICRTRQRRSLPDRSCCSIGMGPDRQRLTELSNTSRPNAIFPEPKVYSRTPFV